MCGKIMQCMQKSSNPNEHLFFYIFYSLFYNLPRAILHEMLTTEYDQHIDAAIVEHPCPVLQHPFACALMYEIVLKIKDIRIIWRYTDVHVDHFVLSSSWRSLVLVEEKAEDGWIS